MAGVIGIANPTAEIALTAATARTVLRVDAPANQRLKLRAFSVGFDGTSVTAEPVRVELLRVTTAGTMTSLTPVRGNAGSETLQATAAHTATAEPTAGDILHHIEVHPQGAYERALDGLEVPGGGRVAIRCTAPANVNVLPRLEWEE